MIQSLFLSIIHVNYIRQLESPNPCGQVFNRSYAEVYTQKCEFCHKGLEILDLAKDVLITTDYNTIRDYWQSPKIYVAFGSNQAEETYRNNIVLIEDINLPIYGVNPKGLSDLLVTLGEREEEVNEFDGNLKGFDVKKDMNQVLAPGDKVVIKVNLTFKNGASINRNVNHTIKANEPIVPWATPNNNFSSVFTFVTGQLEDYEVKVFKL